MNEQVLNTTAHVLSARWSAAGAKLVELAEAFPAERYDVKPRAEVRSFAEQLRHVAFWNEWLGETLRGGQPDGEANQLPASKFRTKPQIVAALRDSFQAVTRALEAGSANGATLETTLPILEHVGEHYGQMVLYCRLNSVVPPASRG